MVSHVAGHQDWTHLVANFSLILLIGPILEEKYHTGPLLIMMLVTALVTGVINVVFLDSWLMGASGVVFMMILLSSFTNIASARSRSPSCWWWWCTWRARWSAPSRKTRWPSSRTSPAACAAACSGSPCSASNRRRRLRPPRGAVSATLRDHGTRVVGYADAQPRQRQRAFPGAGDRHRRPGAVQGPAPHAGTAAGACSVAAGHGRLPAPARAGRRDRRHRTAAGRRQRRARRHGARGAGPAAGGSQRPAGRAAHPADPQGSARPQERDHGDPRRYRRRRRPPCSPPTCSACTASTPT